MIKELDFLINASLGIIVLAAIWIVVLVGIPLLIWASIQEAKEEQRKKLEKDQEKEDRRVAASEATRRSQETFIELLNTLYVVNKTPVDKSTIETTGRYR